MARKRPSDSSSSEQVTKSQNLPTSNDSDNERLDISLGHFGDEKEWEETRCPICLEHPHNAVLLICSSSEKGCRPYICNTSRRHSNCLHQFMPKGLTSINVVCPFCRGKITGQRVLENARAYMNSKVRSCSLESCEFSGNYSEIRKHARREHPNSHPVEVKPEHQLDWMIFEQEIGLGDVRSTASPFGFGRDDARGIVDTLAGMDFGYEGDDNPVLEREVNDFLGISARGIVDTLAGLDFGYEGDDNPVLEREVNDFLEISPNANDHAENVDNFLHSTDPEFWNISSGVEEFLMDPNIWDALFEWSSATAEGRVNI